MSVCECGSLITETYEHPIGNICSICFQPKHSRKIKYATKLEYERANGRNRKRNTLASKNLKQIEKLEIWNNHYGCRVCGSKKYLTIDHIFPKDKGGQNIMSNKQVLCSYHNNLKSNLLPGKNGWWPDELIGYLK